MRPCRMSPLVRLVPSIVRRGFHTAAAAMPVAGRVGGQGGGMDDALHWYVGCCLGRGRWLIFSFAECLKPRCSGLLPRCSLRRRRHYCRNTQPLARFFIPRSARAFGTHLCTFSIAPRGSFSPHGDLLSPLPLPTSPALLSGLNGHLHHASALPALHTSATMPLATARAAQVKVWL